jgi:hypothetical protein
MLELRTHYDRPTIHGRAEPDDEYDPNPKPLAPKLIDPDDYDIDDDDELDEDNYSN